jgi:hypothetical protein
MKVIKQYSFFEDNTVEIKGKGKICRKCKTLKPLEHFPWRSGEKVWRRETCVSCENYLKRTRRSLKNKVPLPPEDHQCPICLKDHDTLAQFKYGGHSLKTEWCFDHCHRTEKFRGWICHKCNKALGLFDDDVNKLQKAIDYLNENR